MDTTIRNLDPEAYRGLKARAALTGKNIGELVSQAIRAFLAREEGSSRRGSLRDLVPREYPEGTEDLSEKIDLVIYG
jgi:plasmid stability protein